MFNKPWFFFLLFIFLLLVYFLSSGGSTPFNYFTRLANAFIQQRLYITNPPPWLTELIPIGNNQFYVVYPPMPAILLTPIQIIWKNFPQQYLAHILGASIAIIFTKIAINFKKNLSFILWVFLFIGFGNIIWYMSATGSVWYLGQIASAFFMSAAIYETLSRKRPWQLGVLLGAMYLSRIHTIIALPYFLFAMYNKNWFKTYFKITLGLLPFVFFNFTYNYLRFGTIFDTAYFLLPKILNEENMPWFIDGVANISYIPNNIKAMFWTFPKILPDFPFVQPSWAGLAIWITSPVFIYAFFSNMKEKINRVAWISILFIFLIVASHGGTGWAQFGYRFAVDFYPLLFLLTIKGVINTNGPKWHHWILLITSIIVNFWGVVWINFLGWVSF